MSPPRGLVQTFQRHIRAPRARVFAALTTVADYQRWNVPDNMTSVVHELDARQGGKFRVSLTYTDQSAGKSGTHTDTYGGVFTELVPNEKLVQEIRFETTNPALQSPMRITFALLDDVAPAANGEKGTLVSARHEGLPSVVKPEDNQRGWSMSLAKLARICEGRL